MKHSLNRIDPNLHRLETARTTSKPQPASIKRTYSFEISRTPQKHDTAKEIISDSPNPNPSEGTSCPINVSLQPSFGKKSSGKVILPDFNFNRDSCDDQATNPALEINLSQVTQTDVAACEAKLRQIVHQIENLYLEGPIVDGWLESYTPATEPTVATLRRDSLERLIENGEEVSNNELSGVSYRLCGLDSANQKWAYLCPFEQLHSVSMAIARYHKLRQLLKQKHYFETSLKQMINAE